MFEGRDIEADARAILDTLADDGVAVFPVTVGYAVVGHSTIVDLVSYKTFRIGCVYDDICRILLDEFDIDLKAIGTDSIPA